MRLKADMSFLLQEKRTCAIQYMPLCGISEVDRNAAVHGLQLLIA